MLFFPLQLPFIVQITISHDNQKQTFQLDYFPELTVGKIASLISRAFGFKDDILLMTNDNNILFPDIKFAELLLLNPDKYKYLKIHLSKEQQPNAPTLMNTNIPSSNNTNNIGSYSTPVSVTTSLTNPPKLKSNFEIKNPLQKEQSDITANNNIPSNNKDSSPYRMDKNINKDTGISVSIIQTFPRPSSMVTFRCSPLATSGKAAGENGQCRPSMVMPATPLIQERAARKMLPEQTPPPCPMLPF